MLVSLMFVVSDEAA